MKWWESSFVQKLTLTLCAVGCAVLAFTVVKTGEEHALVLASGVGFLTWAHAKRPGDVKLEKADGAP